jgi:hypothetical protein
MNDALFFQWKLLQIDDWKDVNLVTQACLVCNNCHAWVCRVFNPQYVHNSGLNNVWMYCIFGTFIFISLFVRGFPKPISWNWRKKGIENNRNPPPPPKVRKRATYVSIVKWNELHKWPRIVQLSTHIIEICQRQALVSRIWALQVYCHDSPPTISVVAIQMFGVCMWIMGLLTY